jgi:hypothetical protein
VRRLALDQRSRGERIDHGRARAGGRRAIDRCRPRMPPASGRSAGCPGSGVGVGRCRLARQRNRRGAGSEQPRDLALDTAAGEPVIALKLGASEGGRAAAKAHTGARTGLKLAIPRCAIPTASSKWREIPRDLPPKSSVYDFCGHAVMPADAYRLACRARLRLYFSFVSRSGCS